MPSSDRASSTSGGSRPSSGSSRTSKQALSSSFNAQKTGKSSRPSSGTQHQAVGRASAPRNYTEKDAQELITSFDVKFSQMQATLQRLKVGGSGEGPSKRPEAPSPERNKASEDAPISLVSASAAGRRNTNGLPQALADKLQRYRDDPAALAALDRRARQYQHARSTRHQRPSTAPGPLLYSMSGADPSPAAGSQGEAADSGEGAAMAKPLPPRPQSVPAFIYLPPHTPLSSLAPPSPLTLQEPHCSTSMPGSPTFRHHHLTHPGLSSSSGAALQLSEGGNWPPGVSRPGSAVVRGWSAGRQLHADEVKQRQALLKEEWRAAKEWDAGRWERHQEEKRQAMEALRQQQLLESRQRFWGGLVALAERLSFLRHEVIADRRLRPLRAVKKEAAMRIANWYHSILTRRKEVELIMLVLRVKRLLAPHLALHQQRARERCAERIIHFINQSTNSNMAVVAVKKFKQSVVRVQHAWRSWKAIGSCQLAMLNMWFYEYEKTVVRENRKKLAAPFAALPGKPSSAMKMLTRQGLGPDTPYTLEQHRAQALDKANAATKRSSSPTGAGSGGAGLRSLSPTRPGTARRSPNFSWGRRGRAVGLPPDPLGDTLDLALGEHRDMLPREIRIKVVEEALAEERRRFRITFDRYLSDKAVYLQQKPIEDVRMRLLKEAGLDPKPLIFAPTPPRLLVLVGPARLREMLTRGLNIMREQREAAAAQERHLQELDVMMGFTQTNNWSKFGGGLRNTNPGLTAVGAWQDQMSTGAAKGAPRPLTRATTGRKS